MSGRMYLKNSILAVETRYQGQEPGLLLCDVELENEGWSWS